MNNITITKYDPAYAKFITVVSVLTLRPENCRTSHRELANKILREEYNARLKTDPTWGDYEGITFNDGKDATAFLLKWS
jgi:hypothetical protein